MSFSLTDAEWQPIAAIPEEDVIDLAADLGILLPPPPFGLRTLLDRCVPAIVDRASGEGGLPLSKYDLDDLRELPARLRDALARVQGLTPGATPEALVRVGDRVHRARSRNRGGKDPYAFMVPILLAPIARCAAGPREVGA